MEKPWLKFYDSHVPSRLEVPPVLLPQVLDEAADRFPGKPALDFFGGKLSYAALRSHARRFAAALGESGFAKGDRLLLLLPNMPQALVSTFGALQLGGVVGLLDPLAGEEELQRQINEVGAETAVVLDLILPRVDPIFARTGLKNFVIAGVQDYLPFPRDLFFSLAARGRGIHVKLARKPHVRPFKEFLQLDRAEPLPVEPAAHPDEGAVILFTAGTSGPPKGVLLSHRNLIANVLQAAAWIGPAEMGRETFLSILPFHQAFGLTLGMNLPLYLAAKSVHLPQFETKRAFSMIRKYRPTFFPAAPWMIEQLAADGQAGKFLSSVRICWSLGQPLSEEVLRTLEGQTGRKISPAYGLTEASPLTHGHPIQGKRKVGSIGIPLSETEARIVDPKDGDRERPPGEEGELVVRGPQVMLGYWNRPEETARVLRGGWLHTGDRGRMDEEGYFHISGRVPAESPKG